MALKRKVGAVFVLLSLAAACELMTTIILGRTLPAAQFGKFKFLNTIVVLLSGLLVLGQNTALIRTIGKNDFARYDWRSFLSKWLVLSALAGLVSVLGLCAFYGLYPQMVFTAAAFLGALGVEYYSPLLRCAERYNASILLAKLPPILLAPIVVVGLLWGGLGFEILLYFYAAVFMVSFLAGLYAVRAFPCGSGAFPRERIKEGLWFFLVSISSMVMTQVDQFFIAKMLGYEQLAAYTAVNSVTRGFELFAVALWFVVMPHYAKGEAGRLFSDTLKAGAAALLLAVFYWFFGNPLLHLLFDGRFDSAMPLMVFFILSGVLRVVYNIPAAIIAGKSSSKFLRVFLPTSLVGIAANILGNLWLIPLWGLQGSAVSTLGSWVLRVVFAYLLICKERQWKS